MAQLVVQPVVSRRDRRDFLELPWRIYDRDPHWIPPLWTNQAELTGLRPHPFYDENLGRPFLARRDGRPVGRVVAIVNGEHNRRYEPRGMFGFFECEERQDTADALLGEARKWLAEQGLTAVRGPLNPSLNYECGLLVEGFRSRPTFMMTYNPPYYARLLENHGFRRVQDLYAFYARLEMLDGMDKKLHYVYAEATRRFDVRLRCMDRSRFDPELRMFLDIYNRSMEGSWGFTPLTDKEIEHTSQSLKWLIEPELTSVAEVDGKPVGAMFALLDYNPRIRAINGRLFPWGVIRLLWNKKAIRRMRLISTNVLPEYQRWGIGLLITGRLLPVALRRGMNEGEFSWVAESNALSRKTLERGGALLEKTYRIYDWLPAAV